MKKIIYCISFVFVSVFLFALDVPPLAKAVNDYANVLSSEQQEVLEKYLQNVSRTSKLQVALLILPRLEGEVLEDYSMRVVDKWKLGNAEIDSGVLLLIAKEERKLRVEVGYGLEKDLTDAISSKIINDIIAPSFKQNDYYNGIKNGLEAIVAYSLKDETLIKESEAKADENDGASTWFVLIGLVMFFIFSLRSRLGRAGRGRFGSYSIDGAFKNRSSKNSFSGKGGRFGGGGASGGW